jgi:Phage tail assembly chaperone proteins, E, or 41 or 14
MADEQFEDPYILKLSKPISIGTEVYEEITLTEPTAGQVEKASAAPNASASNIVLVSMVSNVPELIIRRMTYRDFSKAVAYLENFLRDGRKAGES